MQDFLGQVIQDKAVAAGKRRDERRPVVFAAQCGNVQFGGQDWKG
jgi:hypothetical protein